MNLMAVQISHIQATRDALMAITAKLGRFRE
jgi:hypothetical protein